MKHQHLRTKAAIGIFLKICFMIYSHLLSCLAKGPTLQVSILSVTMTGILTNLKIDGSALGPLRWQINIHFNPTRRDFKKH